MKELYKKYNWKEFKEIIMVKEIKREGNKITLQKLFNNDILELIIVNGEILEENYIEG